jgi:hypothetical protein
MRQIRHAYLGSIVMNFAIDAARILGEESNRKVFSLILRNRKVQLKELIETGYSRDRVTKALTI